MSTVPSFLNFIINAVLRPTVIRKLCYYKLPSIVTFTFIQNFFNQNCAFLTEWHWQRSKLPRLLHTASKFALFSVSGLKDEKLIKKQTYIKTETCRFYSRVSWTFVLNFIKFDPYNFWAIPFQSWCIFETQCRSTAGNVQSWCVMRLEYFR